MLRAVPNVSPSKDLPERATVLDNTRHWLNTESSTWCSSAIIWLYCWIYGKEFALSATPQKRALDNYRKRLKQRGIARFEVLGLDADRDLIRSLARRLAGDGPDSARIRATVRRSIAGEPPKKGGILDALRRSPLVGADLDLKRPITPGRKVDL
jgi:hypothetical protein